jgi:thymidine phosphorylase
MLALGGAERDFASGRKRLEQLLVSGKALDKFRELVHNQGGDARLVDRPELLPTAKIQQEVESQKSGWITEIDTAGIGKAAQILGAGRSKKGESIDLAVGLEVLAKPGEWIEAGQPLAVIHANSAAKAEVAREAVSSCYSIGETKKEPLPLICGQIGK